MNKVSKPYSLEERTALFGEDVIKLCKKVKQDTINRPLMNQVVRSSTSVGANYMEANGASSKADFVNKISLCKKESQETKHWFRMLSVTNPELKEELKILWKECQELTMIFQKIITSSRNKK